MLNTPQESENPVNILSVNSVLVNIDIISGSYLNGLRNPTIYSFFPAVSPGYKIIETPANLVYQVKERGLKGYSNKNKSELLRLLEAQENPLDQPVPDINVPVLTPQPPSRVQRFKEYAADKRQIFKKYANYKWHSFVNWLTQHLPLSLK